MNYPPFKPLFLLASLLLALGNARAEDIDIYAGSQSNAKANLLVVMDNSGSWSASTTFSCPVTLGAGMANSAGGFEACGFYNALEQIRTTPVLLDKLNLGLMLYGQGSTQGGVFHNPASPPPLLPLNSDGINITAMQKTARDLQQGAGAGSNTANSTDVGGAMQEAWAYYTGNTGMSGTTYRAPSSNVCGKNFVIFIGISRTSSHPYDSNSNNVLSRLVSAGATTAQQQYINWTVNNKYSTSSSNWGDEWTRFNFQSQGIVTYTITLEDSSNPNPDYYPFMNSMAVQSGGKAFKVNLGDMDALVQALLLIFNEVQAVNSVFAAATLPISVNAQGTYLNQIYMGMFRPDAVGQPRWMGNLKQYQFGVDATNPSDLKLFMADATGASAISSAGTGFISPNAQSFWTSKDTLTLPDSIGGMFVNKPQGVGDGFDLPDGEVVEKGGVAQQIRLANLQSPYTADPTSPRKLFTCIGSCAGNSPLSDSSFDVSNTNITAALLGTSTQPPVDISSITRDQTTATATHASSTITNGQAVTVTGSQYAGLNGSKSAGGPPTSTTFSYPVTITPPTTAVGTYTATVPFSPQSITSLTRSGTTVTANVPGHAFGVGAQVTITGATGTEYNGTFAVVSSTPGTSFTYTIADGPVSPGNGGCSGPGGCGSPVCHWQHPQGCG